MFISLVPFASLRNIEFVPLYQKMYPWTLSTAMPSGKKSVIVQNNIVVIIIIITKCRLIRNWGLSVMILHCSRYWADRSRGIKPESHRILPMCDRSAMFATITSSCRILRSVSGLVTNDWRTLMAIFILANSATSGSDQLLRPRQIVRSIVTAGNRWYDQSLHPAPERTINHDTRRPIVGFDDRSHVNYCILRPTVRSIVALDDKSYNQSFEYRPTVTHNWWCDHAWLVVRSRKTYLQPLMIWNCRLEVLTLLRLILLQRSPTTCATSRFFFLRFAHDSKKKSFAATSQAWCNWA